ncbi:ABC transporter ATP-binding protein [Mesorhizobium sp. LHD-90]|uniref:ABC transporter ATP-binding protein n=1 Tax=Mesorhizobium sp. LHD-90 TaxID=3071414 RepID=UPI0027DFFC9C|nr:ABC transporter ATP-binding protein [Mesorhizobium sp. LHD-90]MDQ6438291.1 ABC transporter ATP-binding protein [Mesorhizobium sp. LHD-90]
MTSAANDVEFRSVSKRYGEVRAVSDVDLAVPKGAFVALLGPSGCGKTTCLRMIGGFEQPSEGTVLVDDRPMNGVPPYRRPVNMVFQHYALFPHLDVEANVSYGLRQMRPRIDRREVARRTGEALELVRLGGYSARKIHELSGGQQQRVALARAIINRPSVLLLDEPLAALDRKLRTAMQIELQSLQRELGITFVLVTHDQEEALSMSDFVCVMNAGRVVQMAPPQEVYDRPGTLFVADFVGKTNRLSGVVEAGGRTLRLADGRALPVSSQAPGAVTAVLRPEAIAIAHGEGDGLAGTVTHRIFLGNAVEYAVAADGIGEMLVTADRSAAQTLADPGDRVTLRFAPESLLVFPT